MPEKLTAFLKGLKSHEAAELWIWLDLTPDATGYMVEALAKSHPDTHVGALQPDGGVRQTNGVTHYGRS